MKNCVSLRIMKFKWLSASRKHSHTKQKLTSSQFIPYRLHHSHLYTSNFDTDLRKTSWLKPTNRCVWIDIFLTPIEIPAIPLRYIFNFFVIFLLNILLTHTAIFCPCIVITIEKYDIPVFLENKSCWPLEHRQNKKRAQSSRILSPIENCSIWPVDSICKNGMEMFTYTVYIYHSYMVLHDSVTLLWLRPPLLLSFSDL